MKLPKSARIHHRSLQEKLFLKGKSLHEYPIRMIWRAISPQELRENFRDRVPDLIGPVQVLVSVPKKKRKRAVDRVRMRRLIREAFRLGRGPLVEKITELPEVRTVSIGFVYQKDENIRYEDVKIRVDKLIGKLIERLDTPETKKETEQEKKI